MSPLGSEETEAQRSEHVQGHAARWRQSGDREWILRALSPVFSVRLSTRGRTRLRGLEVAEKGDSGSEDLPEGSADTSEPQLSQQRGGDSACPLTYRVAVGSAPKRCDWSPAANLKAAPRAAGREALPTFTPFLRGGAGSETALAPVLPLPRDRAECFLVKNKNQSRCRKTKPRLCFPWAAPALQGREGRMSPEAWVRLGPPGTSRVLTAQQRPAGETWTASRLSRGQRWCRSEVSDPGLP